MTVCRGQLLHRGELWRWWTATQLGGRKKLNVARKVRTTSGGATEIVEECSGNEGEEEGECGEESEGDLWVRVVEMVEKSSGSEGEEEESEEKVRKVSGCQGMVRFTPSFLQLMDGMENQQQWHLQDRQEYQTGPGAGAPTLIQMMEFHEGAESLQAVSRKRARTHATTWRMLNEREQGVGCPFRTPAKVHISKKYLPDSWSYTLSNFESKVYCGQFSPDGSIFASTSEDGHLRLYHTDSMRTYRPYKEHALGARNILDIDYSPDQRWMICAPLRSRGKVSICNTDGERNIQRSIDFRELVEEERLLSFMILAVKFFSLLC
ncbi:hypothetical protein CBR_g28650 [Chara braunii]|uniref:Uncharacterized protein n=1 Tax=Chara braunii TaxID=69332 RepID=A0A388L9H2_CHABU|nr:hypothetical protein CBR_g28650 [Chara braunii]|eukprot:GBG78934.1 hypothetical protein CBR_g28650 [Chara braunii]